MSEETLRFVRGGFQELGQEKAHFSWDYCIVRLVLYRIPDRNSVV